MNTKIVIELMVVMATIALVAMITVPRLLQEAPRNLFFLENTKALAKAPRIKMENIQAFHPGELIVDSGRGYRSGQILLANEARFTSEYYSEPLTNYSVGWRDPNDIEATLNFLFPPVQVGRRFEWKKAVNAEEFYSETFDDARSIGGDFKKVEFKGTSVNDKTLNKGLTIIVDMDEVAETPNWQTLYAGRLLRRLLRNELRRGVTLAAAAATNTAKTWDTTAGKDPDQDMLAELSTATDDGGIRPNRGIIGEVAWNKRALAHRAQNTAGGFASAGLTPDAVAGFLGLVGGMKISRERYQSAAAAKSKVTPDIVLFFYAEDGVGPEDGTNFKRFWSACEGGTKFRTYLQQISSKLWALSIEHYSQLIATSTLGLRKLTIS